MESYLYACWLIIIDSFDSYIVHLHKKDKTLNFWSIIVYNGIIQ